MKNLIYQYWDGNILPGCQAGVDRMKQYADTIGADYLFEHNPKFVTNLGTYSPHYGSFKPIYTDSFHEYDNVLFTDTDVFAVDGLEESIFENFTADIGICTEPLQPKYRQITPGRITSAQDELWAATVKKHWGSDMPRTDEGLLKVYNSGVVMYSNVGLANAKKKFIPFIEYVRVIKSTPGLIDFYTADQNYIHTMLTVADMNYVDLDNEWNCFIKHTIDPTTKQKSILDPRTENTKFVHIQMRGSDHLDAATHWRITNLPVEQWGAYENIS